MASISGRNVTDKFLLGLVRSSFLAFCFIFNFHYIFQVASSDATNICSSIVEDGDDLVLNGRKWWTSGVLDSRMKVIIFMGKSDPQGAGVYFIVMDTRWRKM